MRDRGGGGYHYFRSKMFCLTVPKPFVEEPLCVSEFSGIGEVMERRREGREYLNFLFEVLLSCTTIKLHREPICV